jgi:hypothetical protein
MEMKNLQEGLGFLGGFIGSSFDSPTLGKSSFSWSSPSKFRVIFTGYLG